MVRTNEFTQKVGKEMVNKSSKGASKRCKVGSMFSKLSSTLTSPLESYTQEMFLDIESHVKRVFLPNLSQ